MQTFNAEKTTKAVIDWIRDFFKENGEGCRAVIGISGGKDSAVTAALCAAALGKDMVTGVLMPQGEQHDFAVAKDVAAHLGIDFRVVNIKSVTDTLYAAIETDGAFLSKQALVNTPARVRMTVLYAVAASVNGRVANTCNLSEDYVGYSTKFGDSAGDFSPLMNLTVTEVKAVGACLGLPSRFLDKTPEDGLSGKSDEDNLGFTYAVLDKYIRTGICEDTSVKNTIDKLHKASLHKLAPLPGFVF